MNYSTSSISLKNQFSLSNTFVPYKKDAAVQAI